MKIFKIIGDYRNIRSFNKRVDAGKAPDSFRFILHENRLKIGELTRKNDCKLRFYEEEDIFKKVKMDIERAHTSITDYDMHTAVTLYGIDGTISIPGNATSKTIFDIIKEGIASLAPRRFSTHTHFHNTKPETASSRGVRFIDPG